MKINEDEKLALEDVMAIVKLYTKQHGRKTTTINASVGGDYYSIRYVNREDINRRK